MDSVTCKNCQYYRQHYCLHQGQLFRVFCGHCTFTRTKKKYPDTKGCEHFVPAPSPTDSFVTKEYLSKELLRYILDMELLPEIEEIPYLK